MLAWRWTDGAHRVPWLVVEQLRAFLQGALQSSLEFRADYSQRIIHGLSQYLQARIPTLDHEQRKALWDAVAEKEEAAAKAVQTAQSEIQAAVRRYWGQITDKSEFCFSLLVLQHLTYPALFFAYEHFLTSAIRATKDPNYSSLKKKLGPALTKHFGPALADHLWQGPEIDVARLVRNAVAHNGGAVGAKLDNYKARFVDATEIHNAVLEGEHFNVVNGTINIVPCNTSYLFGILKECARIN